MRFIRRSAMISLLVVAPILIHIGVTSAAEVEQISLTYPMQKVVLRGSHYKSDVNDVLIALADRPSEFYEFSFLDTTTPVETMGKLSTTWGSIKVDHVVVRGCGFGGINAGEIWG